LAAKQGFGQGTKKWNRGPTEDESNEGLEIQTKKSRRAEARRRDVNGFCDDQPLTE
jgi:hypothetical protein